MSARAQQEAIDLLAKVSRPLQGMQSLDALLDRIGDARIVMLGEASHGTHEFYAGRRHVQHWRVKS